jgi:hypothetical protein
MSTFLFAVALSAVACMAHAGITRRWDVVRGGVPFAAVFGVAGLIVSQLG